MTSFSERLSGIGYGIADFFSLRNLLIMGAFGLIALPITWKMTTVSIKEGEAGILLTNGRAKDEPLAPGLHFKIPVFQSVERMQTRLNATQANNLVAPDKNGQAVILTLVIKWNLSNGDVVPTYRDIGSIADIEQKIILPTAATIAKQATVSYDSMQVLANRANVEQFVSTGITKVLEERYGLTGVIVDVPDISFSQEFEKALEQKAVEVQNTQIATQRSLTAEQVKQEEITKAQGEAEAARLKAEAARQPGSELVVQQALIEAWRAGGSQVPVVTTTDGGGFFGNLVDIMNLRPKTEQQ